MKTLRVLTALLIASAMPSLALAAPRQTTARQNPNAALVTAILISSAETQAAVDRSDAVIRQAYSEKQASQKRLSAALKAGKLSEQQRRISESELAKVRSDQEAVLAQLAAKDGEYRASLAAYREGLTGLLTESSPEIASALGRYSEGDASALDDLQAVVRLIRRVRAAGVAARDAIDQRGVAQTWMDAKDKGQKTTAQALAAWQEAAQIDPNDVWQWIFISRLQAEAGNLVEARAAAETSLKLARELLVSSPFSEEAKRDVGAGLGELGDVAVAQGRLADAATAYEESLALNRALLAINPTNADAQSDVSLNLMQLGDVQMGQGRLIDAAIAYGQSLVIDRALLVNNPASADAKRSVSVGLLKIGEVETARGHLDEAASAYTQSLALSRALLAINSSSAEAKRDVSVELKKLGDLAVAQNRLADAAAFYRESLTLDRTLFAINPTNAEAKRDVALDLQRIGDVAIGQGRLADAAKAWKESMALVRALLASDPSAANARRDVSVSLQKLADLAIAQGRLEDAASAYGESLTLDRARLASDPTSALAKIDVIRSLENMAQASGSSAMWREAFDIAQQMDREGILPPSYRGFLDKARQKVLDQ